MNVYILTALSIRNGNASKTKPMAFSNKEDAISMLCNRVRFDLLNLSDFREDMDMYQQEDFMKDFLNGSNFVILNEYEVMFNILRHTLEGSLTTAALMRFIWKKFMLNNK